MKPNFRVLGAGIWGLSFSNYLLSLGHNVEIFCRNTDLTNKNLPINISSELNDMEIKSLRTLNDYNASDAINIVAVNSKGFSDLLNKNKNYFHGIKELVWLTKGLDHETGSLLSNVAYDITRPKNKDKDSFGNLEIGIISGPSFAKDLFDKKNISVSFATNSPSLQEIMMDATSSSYFKMIPTTWLWHIEISGIIKNIAAILSGMADHYYGSGEHTNNIIKKACNESMEMAFAIYFGYLTMQPDDIGLFNIISKDKDKIKKEVLNSPGFIGDMILTCKQKQSRNYQFGYLIAEPNIDITEAVRKVGTVEGYDCCLTLVEKSYLKKGELVNTLYKIINADGSQRQNILDEFLQT
tara:strand:+ start:91 stop:1149 length:1059 start_codon:yes stop_codon:yes gene_type:complete